MEESLKSKTLYKLLLLLLKYIPMIIALCYLINTIAAIFGLDCQVLSHISGMSLLTWIFIYLSAIVFRFCNYHKMFLWYIMVDDLISITDYYLNIPIEDFQIIGVHCAIAGISLFIILYLYVKSHSKNAKRHSRQN